MFTYSCIQERNNKFVGNSVYGKTKVEFVDANYVTVTGVLDKKMIREMRELQ